MHRRSTSPEMRALSLGTTADPRSGRAPSVHRLRRATRPGLLVLAIAAMALCAACGSSDDDKDSAKPGTTSTTLSAADKTLQEGLDAQSQGNLDRARQIYLSAIDKDPTDKLAYYNLGVVYQQLNDVKSATDAYNKALGIDPAYQPALFNLGVLLTSTDPPAAAEAYRKILAINPDDANVHFNLGLLLRQIGQNTEGNAEVGRALEINPSLASRLPASTPTSTG